MERIEGRKPLTGQLTRQTLTCVEPWGSSRVYARSHNTGKGGLSC